ncbi:MAG: hypothetical protein AAGB19_00540 [Cyanobacteria bacterium P01_F01_bin.3]
MRDKSGDFQRAYDFPDAYRTSNQVDRPMNHLDRMLCHTRVSRYFAGR